MSASGPWGCVAHPRGRLPLRSVCWDYWSTSGSYVFPLECTSCFLNILGDTASCLWGQIKCLGEHPVLFLWDHWYLCFGLLVMSAVGFKARVDPFACMLPCQDMMDLPVVRHLLASFCSSTCLHSFLQASVGLEHGSSARHNVHSNRLSYAASSEWLFSCFRLNFFLWLKINFVLSETDNIFLEKILENKNEFQ